MKSKSVVKITILPNVIYRFNAIPIKLPMTVFTELEQKNLTVHMETQKTPNSQSNLEEEEWSWRNQPSWLQTTLQRFSHQNSMVLAQKEKYRPMEQDRMPRSKPMHLWVPYFWQRSQEIQWGKDRLFNKWCWENWTILFSSVQSVSRVRLFVTSWITAHQASLSITISRSSLKLTTTCERIKLEHFLTSYTKINSK